MQLVDSSKFLTTNAVDGRHRLRVAQESVESIKVISACAPKTDIIEILAGPMFIVQEQTYFAGGKIKHWAGIEPEAKSLTPGKEQASLKTNVFR
ncbi:MAG: hypothetical protein Q8S00_24540 [Deltaproteobacteria bacterium]|nr:hypothetical protein [Deltaproteobacteria bacterium]